MTNTTMTTPADFGLPSQRFPSFRGGQLDAVNDIIADLGTKDDDNGGVDWGDSDSNNSDVTRFGGYCMPTGVGKTPIYMAAAAALGGRTLVLTTTKVLQRQLSNDFAPMGLTTVFGKRNYECVAVNDGGELQNLRAPGVRSGAATCEGAPCAAGVKCSLQRTDNCHLYYARRQALASNVVSASYALRLALGTFDFGGRGLGEFDNLILDEAHKAHDIVNDYVTVRLSRNDVAKLLNMDVPCSTDKVSSWVSWAQCAIEVCLECHTETLSHCQVANFMDNGFNQQLRDLTTLGRKLRRLSTSVDSERVRWLKQERSVPQPGSVSDLVTTLTPVWPKPFFEGVLFRGVRRVLMFSATLVERDMQKLGIKQGEYKFREYPSPFDRKHRPLIFVRKSRATRPVKINREEIRWSFKTHIDDQRELVRRMATIAKLRPSTRGIIHARSYARAQFIYKHSDADVRKRMTFEVAEFDKGDIFEKSGVVRGPNSNRILVSPAVEEGRDYPHDMARWQIIAKVPFVPIDMLVKARQATDDGYTNTLAMRVVCQMYGRIVRSIDDWGETFILDATWAAPWFKRNAVSAKWFRSAWTTVEFVEDCQVRIKT